MSTSSTPVIDIHSHFFPPITQAEAAALDPQAAPWLQINDNDHGMIMTGDKPFRPVYSALWDPARRIAEMDAAGVDLQIMCATPVMFGYRYPIAQALPWAQRMNDYAVQLCSHAPVRLKTLAQVPLQDIDAACKEASRAKSIGHIGVQIGNHLEHRDLDDEGMLEFLTHCANESITPGSSRNSGGSFAFLLGRVDNAWRERDIIRQDCPQPPSSYVDRFFVDSAVFDSRSLELLVDIMGEERVMLGSDYPYPLGEQKVGQLIRDTRFSAATHNRLLGGNARKFFGI